jgi:hypothetical protein
MAQFVLVNVVVAVLMKKLDVKNEKILLRTKKKQTTIDFICLLRNQIV